VPTVEAEALLVGVRVGLEEAAVVASSFVRAIATSTILFDLLVGGELSRRCDTRYELVEGLRKGLLMLLCCGVAVLRRGTRKGGRRLDAIKVGQRKMKTRGMVDK